MENNYNSTSRRNRTMQQCGFCSMVSGLMRRAMCFGSRRGSSESYYRELGEQDTFKIEDRASDLSEDIDNERGLSDDDISMLLHNRVLRAGHFLTMHRRRKKKCLIPYSCQVDAMVEEMQPVLVQCLLEKSSHWKFNAFSLESASGGRCLPVFCIHLLHVYGLIPYFNLDASKAWKLFTLIEEGYRSSNPYHNSVHAIDVTQAMHCFLQQNQIRDHLEPIEILASLIAAIAHDIDHPGVNQSFLNSTSNHLATLYKHTSVLENHHWRSAISCLMESGLIDEVNCDRRRLENHIRSLILATDITRQQEYLNQFKVHLDNNTLDMTKKEHRLLVLQIALKCADISNPCRSWRVSRKWSLKVCEEFFRQGDYERQLRIPISALCDRHNNTIPTIQTGFLKFVVNPLITEWHRFLQNDLSAQMLENLYFNQTQWETLKSQEMADEAEAVAEIFDADMVDDGLETGSGTASDSIELLSPPRRSSLNLLPQERLRDQLRRLSGPLNPFNSSKITSKDKINKTQLLESLSSDTENASDHSVHSQFDNDALINEAKVRSGERLSTDPNDASALTVNKLNQPSSNTEYSTAVQQTRRQSYPLQDTASALPDNMQRRHTTATEGADADIVRPNKESNLIKRVSNDKDSDIADSDGVSNGNRGHFIESTNVLYYIENLDPMLTQYLPSRRESAPVGSQLRDNITALHGNSLPNQLLRRRKSVPTDMSNYSPRDRKLRDMSIVPNPLHRTSSAGPLRRGSAPVPIEHSERRHSNNGGRRKQSPIITICQQWLTRLRENTPSQLQRQSSLPIEVNLAVELLESVDQK